MPENASLTKLVAAYIDDRVHPALGFYFEAYLGGLAPWERRDSVDIFNAAITSEEYATARNELIQLRREEAEMERKQIVH